MVFALYRNAVNYVHCSERMSVTHTRNSSVVLLVLAYPSNITMVRVVTLHFYDESGVDLRTKKKSVHQKYMNIIEIISCKIHWSMKYDSLVNENYLFCMLRWQQFIDSLDGCLFCSCGIFGSKFFRCFVCNGFQFHIMLMWANVSYFDGEL